MHQSRVFFIQFMYVFVKRSGTKRISPFSTHSIAGAARGSIFTNHCLEIIGSMVVWQR